MPKKITKKINRSNIQKQKVKQSVNIKITNPTKKIYKKVSEEKSIYRPAVLPQMTIPIYQPVPTPYNFNNINETISNELEKALNKLQIKPRIIQNTPISTNPHINTLGSYFTSNNMISDKNEGFNNQLENENILNKGISEEYLNEMEDLYGGRDILPDLEKELKETEELSKSKSKQIQNNEYYLKWKESLKTQIPYKLNKKIPSDIINEIALELNLNPEGKNKQTIINEIEEARKKKVNDKKTEKELVYVKSK